MFSGKEKGERLDKMLFAIVDRYNVCMQKFCQGVHEIQNDAPNERTSAAVANNTSINERGIVAGRDSGRRTAIVHSGVHVTDPETYG